MREQVFRGEYDSFMNSREGKNYYLGLLPAHSDKITFKNKNASSTSAIKRNSSLLPKVMRDGEESLPEDMMVLLVKNHR